MKKNPISDYSIIKPNIDLSNSDELKSFANKFLSASYPNKKIVITVYIQNYIQSEYIRVNQLRGILQDLGVNLSYMRFIIDHIPDITGEIHLKIFYFHSPLYHDELNVTHKAGLRRIPSGDVQHLRTNLQKVLADKECSQFINTVIAELPEEYKYGETFYKYKGTLIERFDEIDRAKGICLAFFGMTGAMATYANDRIKFSPKHYHPYSKQRIGYIYENGLSYVSFSPNDIKNSKATLELETITILIHELIHAHVIGGHSQEHRYMDEATLIAVAKLGITPKTDYVKNSFAYYFQLILRQICENIEL